MRVPQNFPAHNCICGCMADPVERHGAMDRSRAPGTDEACHSR